MSAQTLLARAHSWLRCPSLPDRALRPSPESQSSARRRPPAKPAYLSSRVFTSKNRHSFAYRAFTQFLVNTQRLLGCFAPSKLLNAGFSLLNQLPSQRLVAQKPHQRVANRFLRRRVHENRGVSGNLRDRGTVRGNDRDSTRHRLQGWKTEPLVKRGVQEAARRSVKPRQQFLGYISRE